MMGCEENVVYCLDYADDCIAHGFDQYFAALGFSEAITSEEDVIMLIIGLGEPQDALFADDGRIGFDIVNVLNTMTAEFNSCVF